LAHVPKIQFFYRYIQCFFVFGTWTWPNRDRFRLFVPKSYCVPIRSFLGVPDRSPFMTVPDRSWPFTVPDSSPFMTVHRSWSFLTVPERSMSAFDRLMTFFCVYERFLPLIFIIRIPVERLKQVTNDRKRSETLIKRLGTVRNAHERSGTVNGQGRWTVWNDHTVQDHGPKRLQNHGHGTVTFTFLKRKKHCNLS
jgi:hypothetical protein